MISIYKWNQRAQSLHLLKYKFNMAKELDIWKPILESLVNELGGFDNIASYTHCATRLRVDVIDDSKVDTDKLKKIEKAKGAIKEGNQFQIIFGAGVVNKVYKQFDDYFMANATPDGDSTNISKVPNKQAWWDSDFAFKTNMYLATRRGLKVFANIFVPLIPMFVAGGISLALSSFINAMPGATDTFVGQGFFSLFDVIGGALLGMLPVMVAWSTMKQLGGEPVYGIGIGLILVAPALLNSWSATSAIQIGLSAGQDLFGYALENNFIVVATDVLPSGEEVTYISDILVNGESLMGMGIAGVDSSWLTPEVAIVLNNGYEVEGLINLATVNGNTPAESAASLIGTHKVIFDQFAWGIFSIHLIGYQAQVFSALLATIMTHFIYKGFLKITPELLAIVFVPLLTIIFSAWLTLWIVGPIGRGISMGIAYTISWVYNTLNVGFLGFGGAVMGFTNPIWGLTGLHQGFTAIEATLIAETASKYGESFSFITAVGCNANVAMGASVIGYAIVVKKQEEKSLGVSTGIAANLGITEPAVYGINLDLRYPFLAGMIGGAVGGFFVASTGTYCTSMGSASWIGLIQFNPIATDNYFTFLETQGVTGGVLNPVLLGWSPMLKEGIAMSLSFVTAILMTIIFSQTKWGSKMNEERGVEVYNFFGRKNKQSQAKV